MQIKNTLALFTTAAALAVMTGTAQAATIVAPDSASTSPDINLSNRDIDETYNGSGLNDSAANIEDWYHSDSSTGTDYYLGDRNSLSSNSDLTVTFTFNSAVTVDTIHFWTYDRGGDSPGREIKDFDISFSTGGAFTGTTTLSNWLDRDAARIDVDPGEGTDYKIGHQSKTFTEQTGVVAIRFSNIVTHSVNERYVGFSEVRFSGVPEPGSLALLAMGGLLIGARRRRG